MAHYREQVRRTIDNGGTAAAFVADNLPAWLDGSVVEFESV